MNMILRLIMTHWYNFHKIIKFMAGRTLNPYFWGQKMGPKLNFAVITAQKRTQTNENHI